MPWCLVVFLILLGATQSLVSSQVPDTLNSQQDKGVPEADLNTAAATARLIGASDAYRELGIFQAKKDPEQPMSDARKWRSLVLHQHVYERIITADLQTDATVAEIDNEVARAREELALLREKRDHAVGRANLLSALLGGGLGATSAGLQSSSKQVTPAVATGVAGGAIASGLAIYGIHAQRGGSKLLQAESNMLARFFGRPELPSSHYPPVVWQFLSEMAPMDPGLTRRERLLRTWLELKRLDAPDSTAGKRKIEHVTSTPAQHIELTIDDLDDRIAMLEDVRAKLSYLKRDLAVLSASLPELPLL